MKIRRTHGRKRVHRTQRVLQFVDLTDPRVGVVAFAHNVIRHRGCAPCPELRVVAVHPGEHHVDVERDVGGVRGEHPGDRRPRAAVQFHLCVHNLAQRQRFPSKRVLDRADRLLAVEYPELQLHPSGGAVTQAGTRAFAPTKHPQQPRVRVGGQQTVAQVYRGAPGPVENLGTQRRFQACGHQRFGDSCTQADINDERWTPVGAADEQERNSRRLQFRADEQKVLRHRLIGSQAQPIG